MMKLTLRKICSLALIFVLTAALVLTGTGCHG